MKYITYNHSSHTNNWSNGAVFQEILSCYIISIIFNLKVIYHHTWKYCNGFISHNSLNKNINKEINKYDKTVNIDNYLKWESLSFND